MQTRTTIAGQKWVITSPKGCTVTQTSGSTTITTEVPANVQTLVIAQTSELKISDDAAVVTEVFNVAPIAFGGGGKPGWYDVLRSELAALLGEDNFSLTYAWVDDKFTLTVAVPLDITDDQIAQVRVLLGSIPPRNLVTEIDPFPIDCTRLVYLEGSGTQYIATSREVTPETGVKIEYQELKGNGTLHEAVGTRTSGKYWFVPRQSIGGASSNKQEGFYYSTYNTYLKNWGRVIAEFNYKNSGKLYMQNFIGNTVQQALPAKQDIVLPPLNVFGSSPQSRFIGEIWECEVSEGQEIVSKFVPALDQFGAPCMFDTVTRKPFRNDGSGHFIAGVETQKQLNAVLSGLPDRTGQDGGELHLRLSDALYEAAVASGIIEETATAKNWQIAYDPTTTTEAA